MASVGTSRKARVLAHAESEEIFAVRIRRIWQFLRRQPASFWLVNLYMFFEYVRPQSVWPAIDILPWGLVTLLVTLLAAIFEGRVFKRTTLIADPLLLLFSVVVVLSSFAAVYPQDAFAGWEVYFSWVLVYVLITSTVTSEKRFFVFMLGFLLYSFKMSQHGFRSWALNGFAFRDWGVTGGPGWFHNSGEFGIQMCIFIPLSVEFIIALRRDWTRLTRWFFYLMPITAIGGVVASSSRGAVLGAAAVGLWWVIRSKQRFRTLMAVAVLAVMTWTVVPSEQKARFETMGEDDTSTARIDRWKDGIEIAQRYPLFGIGYENWQRYYGGRLSHNIFVEAAAELGFTGLFAFVTLIVATFVINAKTRRLLRRARTPTPFLIHMAHGLDGALIGYMVSGFFVTVLFYPYFWVNLAMSVSLHVAARRAPGKAPVPRHPRDLSQGQRRTQPVLPG